jgi:hypothetical protein
MTPHRLITFAAMIAIAVVAAPVAAAKDGRDVRVPGACTQGSTSKLKLSDENGRIEVEFEVDQNRNGVPWNVTLRRNGLVVASTTATTRAPSGSFEVRRVVSRARSTAPITAVATRASGERCRAQASL